MQGLLAPALDPLLMHSPCSIVDTVRTLIETAYARRASDIHLDPTGRELRVRLRIDGVLTDAYAFPLHMHSEIVTRVKVLAQLRTDEHQAAQDGRFRFIYPSGSALDLRISIAPTYWGESAVLRLLYDTAEHSLERLGFSEQDRHLLEKAVQRSSGMLLSTGPTGSGKTTTLYTLLKRLNQRERKVITIEDPIEYAIDGVEQIQVNPRAGLTFETGLRSILRRDPNIIMVGEIRDKETAAIAVNTALSGHLLLSTLHTSDAATTLPRLLDLGVDAYLVASTIELAIGQRLVRRLCDSCKEAAPANESIQAALAALPLREPVRAGEQFYRAVGCDACSGTGYVGRLCVSELLLADDSLRDAVMRKASASELRALAIQGGMTPMLEDGFAKARRGETTIEELLRVIHV